MNFILVSFGILCILMSEAMFDSIDDVPRARNRCPFIKNSLRNGRVKIRSRGRIAKFICNPGYELFGSRFATCVRGHWNKEIPVCVNTGCPVLENPSNGRSNVLYDGALVAFMCNPGYILNGSANVYCDGTNWNDTAPTCDIAILNPKLTCDFEESTLCGWTNDRNHDFDWRRHQFSTPSGHVGTGPSYDHTLGKGKDGYYMYIEASSPRKQNDTARLFSPVYSSDLTPGCFVFWYHMYGATTGTLRVFMKKESQMFSELTPVWEREGEQGNLWLQSNLSIAKLNEKFQLIIEGIRGNSYVGDTAIDDVALYSTPCEELAFANITKEFDSCQGRCNIGMEENATCYCSEDCVYNATCCDDFENFCTKSANRTFIFGPEPQPKPFTTTKQEKFSTSKFTTSMATEEPRKISLAAVNTTVTPIQPYVSTSNNFTKLTSLLNSTFAIAISPKYDSTVQTDLEKSSSYAPSGFRTLKITNETSNFTRKNVEESTTTVKFYETTTNFTTEMSLNITSSTSTSKAGLKKTTMMQNETIPPTTERGKVEQTTTQKPNIEKITITQQPTTTRKTTTAQSITTQNHTISSKNITQQFTTKTQQPTVSTIIENTTIKHPIIIQNATIQRQPETTTNITSQQTTQSIILNQTLTIQNTTEYPLTKNQTATSQKKIRTTPKISLKPKITVPPKKATENTTTSTQTLKTTEKTSKSISITQKTTKKIATKTTIQTTKTKVTGLPVTKPQSIPITQEPVIEMTTETSITTPKKTAINRTVFERFTINKKTTAPIETTFKTTKVSSHIDKDRSTTITATDSNTKKSRTYMPSITKFRFVPTKKPNIKITVNATNATTNTTLQPESTSNIYIKSSAAPTTAFPVITTKNHSSTSSPTIIKENTSKLTTAKKLLHTEFITTIASSVETIKTFTTKSETNFNPFFEDTTELIWTIDYSARTKNRNISRRPSKANSSIPLTVIAAITVGISITVLFLIGVMCFCFRKRKISQNKLSEDSEMKYLSENEISEFSDPSLIIS